MPLGIECAGLDRYGSAAMPALRIIRRAALAAFYLSPWAWLVAFTILFAGAVTQFGGFPSYANPDPKWIEGFGPVWTAGWLLLVPAVLSPLVVGGEAVWRLARRTGLKTRAGALAVYALGFACFAAIVFGDAFGMRDWFMD
jgi:hypothetical protein